MHQGGFGDRAGEMRDHADIVGFRHGDDLHIFANAADIGQRRADIVDQLPFDKPIDVPFVPQLFALAIGTLVRWRMVS